MVKVKELIDFVEIKDVIDIDSDIDSTEDKKNIVKDYIISDNLKEHILLLQLQWNHPSFSSIRHEKTQVILLMCLTFDTQDHDTTSPMFHEL